jgi:hypothetical protein
MAIVPYSLPAHRIAHLLRTYGFFVLPMAIAPTDKSGDRYSWSGSFDFEW